MKELFHCEVGLSDQTMVCGSAAAAVAQGATLIKKDFKLNRADGGVDAVFSLEPKEFKILRSKRNGAWQSLGSAKYSPVVAE
jgi:sialic acid synthase SpsE